MKAVVDVGSNSILLTVAKKSQDGYVPILETSEVTALGEGLSASGLLREDAMARTLVALRTAFESANRMGAHVAAYGTMALRVASNSDEFLRKAKAQGTPVTIISGEQEARLGLACVLTDPLFSSHDRITIVDVGGQSTEIATSVSKKHSPSEKEINQETHEWETVFEKSFPIGTLKLRATLLQNEVLDSNALIAAVNAIDQTFSIETTFGGAGTVVALGATATNLISIRERLTEWDAARIHGQLLSFEEISQFVAWSSRLTDKERDQIVGLEKGREKTIHIGALLLERSLQKLNVEECYVSARGWRHALLNDTYEELLENIKSI
jgi:exopolyphosphatase/guanosine-5'-triphosphate,3'-diphosphate pyrophosphatase